MSMQNIIKGLNAQFRAMGLALGVDDDQARVLLNAADYDPGADSLEALRQAHELLDSWGASGADVTAARNELSPLSLQQLLEVYPCAAGFKFEPHSTGGGHAALRAQLPSDEYLEITSDAGIPDDDDTHVLVARYGANGQAIGDGNIGADGIYEFTLAELSDWLIEQFPQQPTGATMRSKPLPNHVPIDANSRRALDVHAVGQPSETQQAVDAEIEALIEKRGLARILGAIRAELNVWIDPAIAQHVNKLYEQLGTTLDTALAIDEAVDKQKEE